MFTWQGYSLKFITHACIPMYVVSKYIESSQVWEETAPVDIASDDTHTHCVVIIDVNTSSCICS